MRATPGRPHSRLEALLRAGKFAVTAEMQPSNGADPDEVRHKLDGGWERLDVDSLNEPERARIIGRSSGR